jgi:hypothetical protein
MNIAKTEERNLAIKDVKEFYGFIFHLKILRLLDLTEDEYELLKMKWLELKTFEEIAEHFGWSKVRVKQFYHKAILHLQESINRATRGYKKLLYIVEENKRLHLENQLLKMKSRYSVIKEKEELMRELCKIDIRSTELSPRAKHCLQEAGAESIGDILKYRKKELLYFPHIGRKTLNEIEDLLLNGYGLNLRK